MFINCVCYNFIVSQTWRIDSLEKIECKSLSYGMLCFITSEWVPLHHSLVKIIFWPNNNIFFPWKEEWKLGREMKTPPRSTFKQAHTYKLDVRGLSSNNQEEILKAPSSSQQNLPLIIRHMSTFEWFNTPSYLSNWF